MYLFLDVNEEAKCSIISSHELDIQLFFSLYIIPHQNCQKFVKISQAQYKCYFFKIYNFTKLIVYLFIENFPLLFFSLIDEMTIPSSIVLLSLMKILIISKINYITLKWHKRVKNEICL